MYEEELRQAFTVAQDDLARMDLDIERLEVKLLRCERYSLLWHQHLENLNALNKKRQMIVSRLADIRIALEKEKARIGI